MQEITTSSPNSSVLSQLHAFPPLRLLGMPFDVTDSAWKIPTDLVPFGSSSLLQNLQCLLDPWGWGGAFPLRSSPALCAPNQSAPHTQTCPPTFSYCDPALSMASTQSRTQSGPGENRNQLTWEGEAVLHLPHRAVGGPHGRERSLARRQVVLAGTQLLLGEELALADLLRNFKTNSVPLCPYPVLGEAARRVSCLRAHVDIHVHKHIHTQPKNEPTEPSGLLHTTVPHLWDPRRRTSPLSPSHQKENRDITTHHEA